MSVNTVNLEFWDSTNKYHTYEIENVDLDSKVEVLKDKASQKFNNSKQSIELVYCGLILDDQAVLSSYGVTTGVTIHVVNKPKRPAPPQSKTLSETEVQQLVSAFRKFTSSNYRAALQRLSRPETIESVLTAVPALSSDPVALAIVQDPELIVHMSDPDTVRRAAEKHPTLIEAATYIAGHLHESAASADAGQPGPSSGYSYSLEALSDDEDMDTGGAVGARDANPLARNASYNAITTAQLAAAIASATNTAFNANAAGVPPAAAPPAGGLITSEMFSSAIQQAMGGGTAAARSDAETIEAITRRLQPQLRQMHEMGLVDDTVNVRALQATSGDVQAAIELVFNGVID